jgi:hypothetical protein
MAHEPSGPAAKQLGVKVQRPPRDGSLGRPASLANKYPLRNPTKRGPPSNPARQGNRPTCQPSNLPNEQPSEARLPTNPVR